MANARGKSVDTTRLSIETAMEHGWIHRDYLAHCLRYSHVVKYLHGGGKYKTVNVLDIGCGGETPLAKTMYHNRLSHTSGSYTGVDYGTITKPMKLGPTAKFNMTLHEKTDYVKFKVAKQPDVIVCFEVLEHVEPMHAFKMLKKMGDDLADGGKIFISTPVFDPRTGAAANHVNEMSFKGLKLLIKLAGLDAYEVFGTFASMREYKPEMSAAQKEVFDELSDYYDSNVISCLMAPMFPEKSRNCLWVLQKPDLVLKGITDDEKKLSAPINSSSELWADDFRKILKATKNGKV